MAPSITIPAQGGMFHTFQGVTPRKQSADSTEGSRSSNAGISKRITTPHACAECKRRKIRCDGQQPCSQCLSSRAPKRCFYDKHRQRVIPSRKTLEALSQSLEECRSILKRLFPSHDVQALLPLPRHQLLELLGKSPEAGANGLPSPPLNPSPVPIDMSSPSETGLSGLEQMSCQDMDWDDDHHPRDAIADVADDVNALSFPPDRQASYLGASSIKAALMVMLKVQPGLRNTMTTPPFSSVEIVQNLPVMKQKSSTQQEPQRVPWSWKGQTLIDAYFKRIHIFIPMLDEASFRADYLEGQRFDIPWLALLNAVFAMGSIVAMKSDDYGHLNYYTRAMEYLPIESLGSSHIETVQALALIGGYYLHYINRPNMANAVLGAAIRMASALGLHRESLAYAPTGNNSDITAAETRRRTWWSLFCLDTWATTTLSRPSFGRWGPAINIRPPEAGVASGRDSAQHAGILPLIENIKFCKIATQVQDLLAISPLLRAEDRCNLDGELVKWFSGLPWLLRTSDPCAEPLFIARCVMKWRYQNLRMLLHRPVLLNLASSGASHAAEHDIVAIEACRDLAKQTIEDISREWARNQMSGWNAVWFLYQAAMIPLVSIFWQWDSPRVPEWQKQIDMVLELLEQMEDWSLAAHRSREVVWRMYEASRQLEPTLLRRRASYHAAAAAAAASATSMAVATSATPLQMSLITTADAQGAAAAGMLSIAGSDGCAEIHMSPIGLEPEGFGDMMKMLDQHGLWNMDGMVWDMPNEEDDWVTQQSQYGSLPSDNGFVDYGGLLGGGPGSGAGSDGGVGGSTDGGVDPSSFSFAQ
ncbi:fungal-specific transcription factor domain-containing protein [Microdochium trichocladiopsis]|uniref:Fungal-specific transcription factor domain-containing protein n=1 Tax=Microdochium trichocladiopsis TaxID=1682393 RepID=A0A9P8Y9T0_9PEZI|nr:fungal-specific transcription factor domain-containing protein [Microdochium trichocladiopsis]KAH7035674.1 fungal-specific transcription factor domain-containing protein [Microdochium trichocladiopsis]